MRGKRGSLVVDINPIIQTPESGELCAVMERPETDKEIENMYIDLLEELALPAAARACEPA